jgi:chromosome segregation protein
LRLTQLKLAGFKSFVDPTTLNIHGQRMGIVGPNGCGKSNVMESVRWVLGESSAKEMRGDSMDAVIFNGSATRKPISRASVELIFDNSLGGAAGEWSQYAEISVKRVIERDKGSAYYINNALVRRRDVADLFLGTGLGGRAYAIIGQNTINRIVEAKPEELRIFLEEAAGISKYKERRRETELRLRDTRENLLRVEDILQELDKQIARLQSQAVLAEKHKNLHEALKLSSALVWALKKRDASLHWQKAQLQVQQLAEELEAQMAGLRNKERDLEQVRQENFRLAEVVNQAQAAYYQANAELANIENQLKNSKDAQERTQAQLNQLSAQLDKNNGLTNQFQLDLASAKAKLLNEQNRVALSEKANQQAAEAVPVLFEQFQAAQNQLDAAQANLIELSQHLQSEQNHLAYAKREASELHLQLEKVQLAIAGIKLSDASLLQSQQTALAEMHANIASLEERVADSLAKENQLIDQVKILNESQLSAQRDLSSLDAELKSLEKIQQSLKNASDEDGLNRWLKELDLQDKPRTWQTISVKNGWETALEAVLGPRLNAISVSKLQTADRPPISLILAIDGAVSSKSVQAENRITLDSIVNSSMPKQAAALQEWLRGFYLLNDGVDAVQASLSLRHGEYLVNKQGDIYSQYSVSYFAKQSVLHGVLERQAQLQSLQQKRPLAQVALTQAEQALSQIDIELQSVKVLQRSQSQELMQAFEQAHQLNLAIQQQQQALLSMQQKRNDLEAERAKLEGKLTILSVEIASKEQLLQTESSNFALMQQAKHEAESLKQKTELSFNQARDKMHLLEKTHQELNFGLRIISNEINALEIKLNAILDENSNIKSKQESLLATLADIEVDGFKISLQAALEKKQNQERALLEARNAMNACEAQLQQHERDRMHNEQSLHPLRDKLEAGRLNEQGARLSFEQCQAELIASGVPEQQLNERLDAAQTSKTTMKVVDLERNCAQTQAEIEALGAVNLAAMQELESEQTRRLYLASQSADLKEAIDTLEDAIRKIDKDTRSRLQDTFDLANQHFNELFVTLFGGGQAGLALLGDEILDTGLQVFAQPPGKKNSTIHLLSGGEKALTALALVFALFRLNPAPFCLMDEVDAPLDDSNTERFCAMVKKMSEKTQFLYVSHNKITMEMAQQLIGVTMQESGVSRIVEVDMDAAVQMMLAYEAA